MTEGADASVEEGRLKSILESLLFAAGDPVAIPQLANALDDVPRETIRQALAAMAAEYAAAGRGIVLEEVAGGYQLRTPKEHALFVRRLLAAKPPRLSRPLMETLAIIAYRQPITRPEIEQLRGVDTGGVLETLLERRLVRIAGRKDAPGRPLMYATTSEFLEVFGLKDLEGLPDLSEFREIERAVEQANVGPIASVETHPEDSSASETHREDASASVESAPQEQTAESIEPADENGPSDPPASDENKSSS